MQVPTQTAIQIEGNVFYTKVTLPNISPGVHSDPIGLK